MMNEIKEFASLLNTPKLKPETVELLNSVLRDMVLEYRTEQAQPVKAAGNELIFTPTLFQEWMMGAQEKGG